MPSPDSTSLNRLLSRIEQVCPTRSTAERIVTLSADPDVDVRTLGDAIAADPALATETMRVANSALFSRKPVEDLRQAVMRLGIDEIHKMALAMAMLSRFDSTQPVAITLRENSVLAGTIAGLLAVENGAIEKNKAFLAGLLGEIGALACMSVDKGYEKLHEDSGSHWPARLMLEHDRYGAASWVIGGKLLKRNNLPADIAEAVGMGFDLRGMEAPPLARMLAFARVAAPEVAPNATRKPADLEFRIAEIAKTATLEHEPSRLLSVCEWAVGASELTLMPH